MKNTTSQRESATLLQVGDRFTCALFEFALMRSHFVDGELLARPEALVMESPYIGGPRVVNWTERETKDGWNRSRPRVTNLDRDDPSRATAVFVVVSARMTGGGVGHGPADIFPDGWHVDARREGMDETVHFTQSGCFNSLVDPALCVRVKSPPLV